MPTEKKTKIIESLQEQFAKSSAGVLTDYRGLTMAELTALRRKLREAGVEYRVVKNTLAQFAARNAGMEDLPGVITGPVGIAFGYAEMNVPAKVLAEYIKASKSTLAIKSGFMGDSVLTAKEVEQLATLPSREVLISQVMAGMQSPLVGLVSVLAGPVRGLMGVLQARIEQMEG